jgi:tetratricopeptide (TPR) repeat protein
MSGTPECDKAVTPARWYQPISWLGRLGGAIRRHPYLAGLAALVLCGLAVPLGVYLWGDYHYRAAKRALEAENWEQARQDIDSALAVWPRSAATHLLAARIGRLSGDYVGAQRHLKEAKQLMGPSNEALQLEWVMYRAQTGEIDQVVAGIVKTIEQNHPESLALYEALAAGYMNELRWFPALQVLDNWLKADPDNAKAREWRGRVRYVLQMYEDAQNDLERALALSPGRQEVRFQLVDMFLNTNNAPKALEYLAPLQQQAPDDPRVLLSLAITLRLQGKKDEVCELLDRILADHPDNAVALSYRGKIAFETGEPAKAEAWLRRAIDLNHGDTEARYNLYLILNQSQRKAEAAVAFKELQQTTNDLHRLQLLLTRHVDTNPASPAAPAEIGEIYLRLGNDKLGAYWLHVALKRDPGYAAAHQALVRYYTNTNQPEKAAIHRRRANAKARS